MASEHLNPTLVSFAAAGAKTATGSGRLCGNISAASLAAVPVPSMVTSLCGGYTTNNSMLDVMVGGCVVFGFVTAIAKTQPDTHDPTVANVGAGPNYTLSANASTKVVNQCRDKNNTVVNLSNCQSDAAYSAFMRFASGRVIVK